MRARMSRQLWRPVHEDGRPALPLPDPPLQQHSPSTPPCPSCICSFSSHLVEVEDEIELADAGEELVEQFDEQMNRLQIGQLVVVHVQAEGEVQTCGDGGRADARRKDDADHTEQSPRVSVRDAQTKSNEQKAREQRCRIKHAPA